MDLSLWIYLLSAFVKKSLLINSFQSELRTTLKLKINVVFVHSALNQNKYDCISRILKKGWVGCYMSKMLRCQSLPP